MKKFIFLRPILIVILMAIAVSSCKKDEYTGKVQINFTNHPNDLRVNIISMENDNVAIFSDLVPDANGVLVKELNIGNYIITPSSQSVYFGRSGFQVQSEKTTTITYDQGNVAHIQ